VAEAAVTIRVRHDSAAAILTRRECHFLKSLTGTGGSAHFITRHVAGSWGGGQAPPFSVTERLGPPLFDTFVCQGPSTRRSSNLERFCLATQMLKALAFLHSRGVFHGNIQPRTICFAAASSTVQPSFRLADFSHAFGEGDPIHCDEQPLSYQAPERILNLPLSHAEEMWSLGCTLAEVALHQPLFMGDTKATVLGIHQAYLGPQPTELTSSPEGSRYFVDPDGARVFAVEDDGVFYLDPDPHPLRPLLLAAMEPTEDDAHSHAIVEQIMRMLSYHASHRPSASACLESLHATTSTGHAGNGPA